MAHFLQSLPIDQHLAQIAQAMRNHSSLVLVAPPGAGKTTRVPPALLPVLPTDAPHLLMLQPRRVAARAAAQRIADEQRWRLGEDVGYHIRFEKRYGPHTRIRVLTEAILTRMLLADQELAGIGCVILDEFHERNLHTDLAIAFLREVQETLRPDLKIVVMSATLDAEPVAKFLGDAPILVTEGRTHPVQISYHPAARDTFVDLQVARVMDEALRGDGDVLVFLPGVGEIERTRRSLAVYERDNCVVMPLHGSLTPEEQQRALRPDERGRTKILLATNIAETSLTIDGVRAVIDSGLARIASFDADRGMDRLDLERISKASATQRAGRAGRQAPGRAMRLWSQSEQNHLADFTTPEIHRVDLASTVLAVHAWGARNPRAFGWFDAPPEAMLLAAEELLTMLGALEKGSLTAMGKQMLSLPVHPRIARLLLAAHGTRHGNDALTLAAILSDDSRTSQRSDPLTLLHRPPPQVGRIRDQLAASVERLSPTNPQPQNVYTLSDLLLLAYPDRLARRRGNDPYAAVLVDGTGVRLANETLTPALAATPLFLALDAHHDPRNRKAEATVHTATPVDESTLERLFPESLRTRTSLEYDADKHKVIAFTRHYFCDLVLHEDPHGKVDPQQAGDVLAEALGPGARDLFTRHEAAARLLARLMLLRHHMPEKEWPAADDAALQAYLRTACTGKRSRTELLEGHALPDALRGALVYPLDRQLEQFAPDTIEVPSGSHIKIEYGLPPTPEAPPPAPVLAVRLQELFGLLDTPRIAGGRAPLLLHLLSPGFKPIQITSDLRSFWSSAYFEVRKDLRVRYPKHKWPEDPLTATPEAKGRRRG